LEATSPSVVQAEIAPEPDDRRRVFATGP
jgi:hypothetical protein